MTVDQAAKELQTSECERGMARARRVVERMLTLFPWETARDEVWCGVHPLLDGSVRNASAKVWSLQVAPTRVQDVLSVLLPISRQLGVSVAVPHLNVFIDVARDLANRKAYPEKTVARYDPRWNEMPDEQRTKKRLYKQLATLFKPHGFASNKASSAFMWRFRTVFEAFGFEPYKSSDLLSLKRPLDSGRSFQRVFISEYHGVGFEVCSGLSRRVYMRAFKESKVRLENSRVVWVCLSDLREHSDSLWVGDDAQLYGSSDEVAQLVLADVQRLIVPLVELLASARGIYDWYFDPIWANLNSTSLSDWQRLMTDRSDSVSNRRCLDSASNGLLMARVLPDDAYRVLLDEWECKLRSEGSSSFGGGINLALAATYRQLRQFPGTVI